MTTWAPDTPPRLDVDARNPIGEPSLARFVTWIPFDSGFRGTGLKVGDLIVGHEGHIYTWEDADNHTRVADLHMDRWLEENGFHAGDAFSLQVERDGQTVTIEGTLDGPRYGYRNPDGKRILGEDGPLTYEKDGFEYVWDAWYRQFVDLAKTVLAGWEYTSGYNTVRLREELEPFAERVQYLEGHYPGPVARATREDFDAMEVILAGEARLLTGTDLQYRTLGEQRARAVTTAADGAFESFLADVKDDLLPDPPRSPDPFEEDTRALVGKTIRLPELGVRDILHQTRGSWYWSGSSGSGYLIDRQAESMTPMYRACDEYIEKVDPYFRDLRVTFVGVIQEKPALVADPDRNVTVAGLRVVPRAALIANAQDRDRRFFVDMRPTDGEREDFAGEGKLDAGIERTVLTDDMTPAQVLDVAFTSLKNGDMDTWLACYADWKVRTWYTREGSYDYVDRTWSTISLVEAPGLWDRARKRLLDDVYGLEVSQVSDPKVVYDIAKQPGREGIAPEPRKVESVGAIVNHIGKVGDEYRTFAGFLLHRKWELQRLDDGPWRITDSQSI